MGKKSTAKILLEEFDDLRKKDKESHLFFGSLVRNYEDLFSRGFNAIFERIVCGKHAGSFFAELIDAALENAKEMHEVRGYPSYQPLKNNFESSPAIIVEREKSIKAGRTKGQQERRLDFLVSARDNYYLGIELKVGTVDSRDQIAKYIQYLKSFDKGKGSYRGVLLYVTVDGVMPGDDNNKIPENDLKRVLPISWSVLADITTRHWEKIGKKHADSKATERFLDYVHGYACERVPREIYNWVVNNLHAIDEQWEAMSRAEEVEDAFLELQNTILSILTAIYGHIEAAIRKNMPESIAFDDLRPKTVNFDYFSNPSFYESEWVDSEDNNKAKFYYHFSDGNGTKPNPPQALAFLIENEPAIYLVSRFSESAKKLRDAIDKKLGKACSEHLPRFSYGHTVYRSPIAKFTKGELKNNYPFSNTVDENLKRKEQMRQFWRDHKKILECIAEI